MIYEDNLIKIYKHDHELPWIKIFTKKPYKEITDCDEKTYKRLLEAMFIAEKQMIEFYSPTKINIASFGNFVPHVHLHVIARFEQDNYFPESVWGKQQRQSNLNLPDFKIFCKELIEKL